MAGPHDDGAGGSMARLYCPACGVTRDCAVPNTERRGNNGPFVVPLGPRDGPAGRLAGALAGRLRDRGDAAPGGSDLPTCPACGKHGLTLTPAAGMASSCPRCGVGKLVGS